MGKKLKITNWFLSPHAVLRLEERKIEIKELESILVDPDEVIEQGQKYILAKKFENRKDNMLAAVVLEKKEDLWLVITVMVNFEKK